MAQVPLLALGKNLSFMRDSVAFVFSDVPSFVDKSFYCKNKRSPLGLAARANNPATMSDSV